LLSRRRLGCESPCGRVEQLRLLRNQRAEVDAVIRQRGERCKLVDIEQAPVREIAHVDEHFVARKGRQGLVGRVTVGRGPQRQELPDSEPHVLHGIEESAGAGPQFADAKRSGQR